MACFIVMQQHVWVFVSLLALGQGTCYFGCLYFSTYLSASPTATRHLSAGLLFHIVKSWTVQNSARQAWGAQSPHQDSRTAICWWHRGRYAVCTDDGGDTSWQNSKSSLLTSDEIGVRVWNLPVNQPQTLYRSDGTIVWISQGNTQVHRNQSNLKKNKNNPKK